MTNKLELKSSHEVIDTVDVADVESIFYCKPTDPDILTVLMKDGKRLYCDKVCPLQEEPVSEGLEKAANEYADGENPTCPCEECLIKTFKAGAEWQKKQDQSTIELAEDHAMLAGMEKMEQQMIEKAIDGQLENGEDYLRIKCLSTGCQPQDDGKLVKLIIIKED